MVTLKELTTIAELEQLETIEKSVWGMPPLPIHQTLTAVKNGGIVIGAFDADKIIGFSYGFAGFKNKSTYLCSHMLGIETSYRSKKIGEQMKQKQKEAAKRKGYSEIHWTFDPLETRNAYLNLTKLKGVCFVYMENAYGEMTDGLNKGLPSDRFEIHWYINSNHIEETKNYGTPIIINTIRTQHNLLEFGSLNVTDFSSPVYGLDVPLDFQQLKSEDQSLALDWRLKTRDVFQQLFAAGYAAVQLIPGKYSARYIFVKKDTLNIGGLSQ